MVDSNATRKTFVVPDIKPLDLYDCTRAKICASVGWLLAKSYGNAEHVPVELREPFYCDQYEQEHLKPPVTRLLLSSELYCRTYCLLQGGQGGSGAPKDNATLLQLLANRGVAPKYQDVPVTDADLRHKPIKMSAHLAVMDALMSVGAMEMVSTANIKGIALNSHLPYSLNDVPLFSLSLSHTHTHTHTPSKIRYRKDKTLSKQKPTFPVVTEVKDLSNGCAIAAVVHYYCPGLLRLEDVCMKESMAVADSLYNLQLIREFCDSCLKSCCPLVLEDLLYTPQELQVNMMSFLAELLGWFEVRRPEFVQPLNTTGKCFAGPCSRGCNVTKHSRRNVRPLSSAVSFSIPFGLDSDVDVVMGGAITRSVSSDNVAPGQTMARVPYTPPEDLSHLLSKPPGSHRGSWATQSSSVVPMLVKEIGLGDGDRDGEGELPTIEEALQIIHNEGKLEPRLHPDGAADGFFLHSPDDPASARHNGRATHPSHPPNPIPLSCSAPSRSGMMYHPHLPMGGKTQAPREQPSSSRTRHTSEGSRDDDSVLRDGSMDSDASEDLLLLPNAQSTPAVHTRGRGGDDNAPDSGVRMTSFAERKKKPSTVGESPKSGGTSSSEPVALAATAPMTSWVAQPQKSTEESPSKSPGLTTEMSKLGARLEEKRKAIEAQKKRIESIFAKHRQRLGKSAFLQLKKEQGEGEREEEGQVSASSTEEDLRGLTLEERLAHMEDEEQQEAQQQEKRHPSVEQEGNVKPSSQLDNKQASLPRREKGAGVAGPEGEQAGVVAHQPAPLGDYNNAVSKLNAALSSLQSDMQRLSEQQNQLIRKKPAAPAGNKSWVIPPSIKSSAPTPTRISRASTPRDLASASSSPSSSRRNAARTSKSPQVQRRAQSVPPKSPKHQATYYHHARPQDLKVPGLSRVLTPPVRPEDEMAQKKAALMEKQQKRAEEMKRRRLEQEEKREKEHDRPRTPGTPSSDSTTQRRDTFTRQEYERRQQLKIMEDLDKVLRQKPTTVRAVKKQRPRTMFRDDSVLSRSKLNKVYSHSTMNLSSMANDTGNSGTLTVRKSPRLMSPGRMANQNGEKDWENASTASSPTSIPEYTGPKLYKEPSFKSNKFIIHNAIARCCLAGKVNEPQKNKIVEEMEKCQANHFLILFRDSSCQFRAVYTMNPETEEMVRLTGIGPRIISPAMVESIYKYSSDRKQFTTIPSKTMSMSVDAFTIPGHLWQSKRPGTPKKLGTPK
uniref:Calmodulin regulated spectrin associated protein family member 3 n=1 Tax=Hucho hucho TaxID=62062 RepID=A0A4W5NJ95_9TELE